MELTTKDIQKYQKRSVPWLRKKAGEYFRGWIRKRDEGKPITVEMVVVEEGEE
jgi:hypothetical protein